MLGVVYMREAIFQNGIWRAARLALCTLVTLGCGLFPRGLWAAPPTISYVQGSYTTPNKAQILVNVRFAAAQIAGDLNVVVVGWSDSTAVITSVRDSMGNAYTLAVGPTVQNRVASQAIYYAKNIVSAPAGGNTVTVTFSRAANSPDIRILEYSGADKNN